MSTRFAHVSLVARDWRRLSSFYRDAFGCVPIGAERDLEGRWLDEAIGLHGAHIRGIHLRLPSGGDAGPTLEIFEYIPSRTSEPPTANRPGFAHIAFEVDDVDAAVARMIEHGGSRLGATTVRSIAGAGRITFAYARDPEGNLIELQRWEA